MKYSLLLATTILFAMSVFVSADTPMDNVNSAITAALKFVDEGRAINYETDAVFTREQLEIHRVQYRYYSSGRRIAVTFIEKSTVETIDRSTNCKTVTISFDASGTPLEGIGYGDLTFSDEQ